MKLTRIFYNQPTLRVAQSLLGCFLIRQIGKQKLIGKIVETEAYVGPNDLASHASRGRTRRNEVMFGHPGHAYIYLVYGMYYMFNIVTEQKDYPAAVLIRAVEPIPTPKSRQTFARLQTIKTNGPGKLCRWFKIDKKLNNADLCGNKIWLENGLKYGNIKIAPVDRRNPPKRRKAKRIGVDYAGAWKNKLWRFYLEGNKWVSKK